MNNPVDGGEYDNESMTYTNKSVLDETKTIYSTR